MKSNASITFLGAAGTVTGSKTLLEFGGKRVLIDCGLFQGLKNLRVQNWAEFPVKPSTVDAVILTHAHLDHCGYLPKLVREGFNGPIHCTPPTADLTKIILEDSAKIQEEEANRANRYGYTSHEEAKPLYTLDHVKQTLPLLVEHEYSEWVLLDTDLKFQLHNAGHILGSAIVEMVFGDKTIVFSGDLGTFEPLLLTPPKHLKRADYIVTESIYGDRLHPQIKAIDELKSAVLRADQKNGILIIPTFAVERAQEIIYILTQLKFQESIPDIPIFLDSPMGANATEVFLKHPGWHTLGEKRCKEMCQNIIVVRDIQQSKSVLNSDSPKIVLAGSGMVTGGRVLHYLAKHIGNPESTVLLAGFQAAGTRGRQMQEGVHEVKFFGQWHRVRAEIIQTAGLSAHADQNDLLKWLGQFDKTTKKIFINHGEPMASHSLKLKIQDVLHVDSQVAENGVKNELG